ncbi:thioesterase family protein [Sphingomonas sp. KC8]|uniref:thioesterase family protein n=1 Tax=Sphingomonas sp. KC8 TaxID=1030157 RepID=UPI0002FAC04D|nr:thioesterase family protein [Sphingomonas sp. KC8]ARS26740.1 hypothetical protein KC8_05490 [Sphingomonas sp. KC8]
MNSSPTTMPFQAYEAVVSDDWIDLNDHLNARYYGDLIYQAHELLSVRLGFDQAYVDATQHSKVVAESHLRYEREIRRGARIGVRSWLLAVDDKRLHFAHELLDLTGGFRAAFAEQLDLHVDLTARRVAPMPVALRDRLAALAETGRVAAGAAALPVGGAVRGVTI